MLNRIKGKLVSWLLKDAHIGHLEVGEHTVSIDGTNITMPSGGKVAGVDLPAHAANPDAHHARGHDHSLAADGTPIAVAGVPNLDAAKITSGRFGMARMPDGTSGQLLTAQGAGNNPAYTPGGGYTQGARVYHNVAQTIPDSVETILAFNSARYDTDTIHDNVTNNSRLTCKTAGIYLIIGQVQFDPNATGFRQLSVKLNGATLLDLVSVGIRNVANQWMADISTIYSLAVNDYVEISVYQSSGGNLNVVNESNRSPEFMMQRIG